MNFVKHSILLMVLFAINISASNLLLLGFNGKRAPSIDKTFDKMMREELVMKPDITLVNLEETRQLNNHINYPDNEQISEAQLESLRKYCKDSTYIIWGTLHEMIVEPQRKQFVKAQISGKMNIDLHIYDFLNKHFAYAGTIKASTEEVRGVVLVTPVKTAMHISATDRTACMEKTALEAVRLCCRVISATISSDKAKAAQPEAQNNPGAGTQKDTATSTNSSTYKSDGNVPPDSIIAKSSPTQVDSSAQKAKVDTLKVQTQPKTP